MTNTKSGFAPSAKTLTVLFVDDYEDSRAAYASAAAAAGFVVEVARDGHEALAKTLLGLPDVVVSEELIGGIDGLELTRRIRRNPRTASIPVILLTGLVLPTLAASAQESGCSAVLTKPCTFEALVQTIRRALRESMRHGTRSA
jgi:CheY-like chemotaxis protein